MTRQRRPCTYPPEHPLAHIPAAAPCEGVLMKLREFGDVLDSSEEAAVLATANGLGEFHRSHSFCSKCGQKTRSDKLGACRRCTSTSCKVSYYPRIDAASIVLVTCESVGPKGSAPAKATATATAAGNTEDGRIRLGEDHVLLGRKRNWPKGRFSTLAGCKWV